MLRRHFMTKASYRPNVTITYHSEKPIVIKKDEYEVNLSDTGFDKNNSEFYTNYTTATITIISHDFSNGIGTIELNSRAKAFSDGTKCIGFGSAETFSDDNGMLQYNDIFVSDVEITLFKISNITHINRIPQLVTKVIFPETLIDNVSILVNTSLVNKVILPPYFHYKSEYPDEVVTSYYAANPNAEIIFTGDLYQRHSGYKNKKIKCPPHLIDKYKEYYTNAIGANNIVSFHILKQRGSDYKNNTRENLYVVKFDNNWISVVGYDKVKGLIYQYDSNLGPDIIDEFVINLTDLTNITHHIFDYAIKKLTIPETIVSVDNYFKGVILLKENFINNSNLDFKGKIEVYEDAEDINNMIIKNNEIVACRLNCIDNFIVPDGITSITLYGNNNPYSAYFIGSSIYIPESVTNITNVLYLKSEYCSSIIVHKDNTIYDSRNNCNAIIETKSDKLLVACNNTIIPNSIKSIESNCLYHLTFDTLIIPDGVTNFNNMFSSIKVNHFNTGNGITKIDSYSGIHLEDIKTIHIGKNVNTINYIYTYSEQFTTITLSEENPYFELIDNCLIEKSTNSLILMSNNGIIPEGVTTIKKTGATYIKNMIIPDSVITINDFVDARPKNKEFHVGKNVEYIGISFCNNSTNIKTVYLYNKIKEIGDYAFADCYNINNIYYNGTIEEWDKIIKGAYIFDNCDTNIIHCIDGDVTL